jgi:hypothetical protein
MIMGNDSVAQVEFEQEGEIRPDRVDIGLRSQGFQDRRLEQRNRFEPDLQAATAGRVRVEIWRTG